MINSAPAELTRDDLADVLTRITGATPNDASLRMHVLAHDARQRQELAESQLRRSETVAMCTQLQAELDALKEWKQIILGTGTDQEAVIRLYATEYTKVAVEIWKRQVADLMKERDALKGQLDERCLLLEKSAKSIESYMCLYSEEAKRNADLTRQLADLHGPTVTYWRNMYVQMEQEAKQRFDDWFVLEAAIDDACSHVNAECENGCGTKARHLLQQALNPHKEVRSD